MGLGDAWAAHSHGLVFMAAVWLLWPHAAMDLIALATCVAMDLVAMATRLVFGCLGCVWP